MDLRAEGDRLLYRPKGAVAPELRAELEANKPALLTALRAGSIEPGPECSEPTSLLDRLLEDSTVAAGIFHSHALDRDFILARDSEALGALSEADRALPVLFFGEAPGLAALGLEGLRVVLDLREAFGPSVALRAVREVGE